MTDTLTEHQNKTRGSLHASLSELEKQMLKICIERGEQLPEKYRHVLFGPLEAPELIWEGKQQEHPPTGVTFNVLEQVVGLGTPEGMRNTGRCASARHAWRNRLYWGDNRDAMAALSADASRREIEAAGGIRLIYIDPPFDVGADFGCALPVGDGGHGDRRVKVRAYRDSWGAEGGSYLSMMYDRLRQMHGLLAEDGSLYLHCDWRSSSMLRLLLDEIFGREAFVNEIVWHYYNKYGAAKHCLPRAHDTIWVYSKSGKHILNPLRQLRDAPRRQLVRENVGGVLKNARDAEGKLLYRTVIDKKCDDVWRIPQLQPASAEWSGYGTQKHHSLLEQIILTGSNPGDLIADFFSGSGTTLAVAQRLGRRWIGCDAGQLAIHTTRKRLLVPQGASGGDSPADFNLLVPHSSGNSQQAFAGVRINFDTQAYAGVCAQSGTQAMGSPLTPDPGLPLYRANFDVKMQTKGGVVSISLRGFTVQSLRPPRDQAPLVLRHGMLLRREMKKGKGPRETALTRAWMDWVDYWAVDFDYGAPGDDDGAPGGQAPFRAHWRSFRTYKSRQLRLTSATYATDCQFRGNVAVQVIDLFGNCWLRVLGPIS